MKCPLCGSNLNGNMNGWMREDQHHYGFSATIQPGARYVKREPAHKATLESDVYVPLVQAAASGIFAGIAGAAVLGASGWGPPLIGGLAVGAFTAGTVWAALMSDHHRLLWRVEEIIGADLDNDGDVGRPSPQIREKTREELVLVHSAGRRREDALQRRFADWVNRLEIEGTAQNHWEQNRGMDREEYMTWRDTLIRLGWADWNSSSRNQGWTLRFPAGEIIAGMFHGGAARAPK